MSRPFQEIDDYLETLVPENFEFTGEPIPSSREEVDLFLKDLRQETKTLPGLVSIYHDPLYLGKKIVRIRLILVYNPNDLDLGTKRFPEVVRVIGTRNILDEHYLSIDTRILENIFKFDPFILPEHLFGKDLPLGRPSDEDIRFFFISRLLDLFASGDLECFYRFCVKRKVNTSEALYALRNLQRLLRMTKAILRKKTEEQWDPLIDRIDHLFDQWPDLGVQKYKYLIDVLLEVPGTLVSVQDRLNAYFARALVVKYRLTPGTQAPQALFLTDKIVSAFTENWDPVKAFKRSVELTTRLEQYVSVLPVSFALQLQQYSTGSSAFNRHIKGCLRITGLEGNLERPYIAWERSQLLEKYLEIMLRLGQSEEAGGLLLGCEPRSQGTLGRAGEMVGQQMSKLRLKKMLRFLREEVVWDEEHPQGPKLV